MTKKSTHYKQVAYKYLLSLICLYITQIFFYIFNNGLFQIEGIKECFNIFIGCTRYALSAISIFLLPYLILNLLPFVNQWHKKWFKITSNIFYLLANVFMLAVNLIDAGYYRFSFKRLTADITRYLGVGGDFNELIPQFLRDYWHIATVFVCLLIVLFIVNSLLNKKLKQHKEKSSKSLIFKRSIVFIVAVPLLILLQRGGLQTRPLGLMHASQYTTTQNTALVLNTPFTLYRTFGKPSLEKKEFYNEDQLNKIYSPITTFESENWADTLFTTPLEIGKTNVCVLILESFSAEYLKTYNTNGISYAPFLDSLAQHSLVFQGISNGKKSIDGIPAVISSLPIMMEESYLTSVYGNNKLGSIASTLRNQNYTTAFFHGGYNGTMGFDNFTRKIGYQYYYGKDEYNNDKDYDGNWGIFDEPFLQYCIKQMDTLTKPFHAAFFTLSSHHPYTMPKEHKNKFSKGSLIVHETVSYTDYALKRFFNEASKCDWFENTLFIITSDHSGLTESKDFKTQLGLFKIPMIIYHPKMKMNILSSQYVQQIDVYPMVIDLLNIENQKIFSFGRSPFAQKEKYYIYYTNGEYLLMIGNYLSKYKQDGTIELFNVVEDQGLKNNIANQHKEITQKHIEFTQAFIQQYNNTIIENKTTVSK
jgi:phosphoglycerol transferase MdoB-like AlkP superfamily enzyme